jgi:hypothetical protein
VTRNYGDFVMAGIKAFETVKGLHIGFEKKAGGNPVTLENQFVWFQSCLALLRVGVR